MRTCSSRTRRIHRFVALTLSGFVASGCLLAPTHDGTVTSTESLVTFRGYARSAHADIEILSSASAAGSFGLAAQTRSAGKPVRTPDGLALYPFLVKATIPHWTSTCAGQEAFIRAKANGRDLRTFDRVEGQTPEGCLLRAVAGGASSAEAVARCDSNASPVVRITVSAGAPTTHTGDVHIDSAADAANWACLQHLEGNLTVSSATLDTIALPSLLSVTGDVELSYPRPVVGASQVAATRIINVPMLHQITGNLSLLSPGPNQLVSADFGLPALSTLTEDLSVNVSAFNADLKGIAALAEVGGDLRIVTGVGDTFFFGFLSGVTQVKGDAYFDLGHTIGNIMVGLTAVVGDFALVDGNPTPSAFGQLTSIGGDALLSGIELNMAPAAYGFPMLASVNGLLEISGLGKPNLRIGLAAGFHVGALDVHGNPSLTEMDAAHLTVSSTGAVAITDNGNLCTSLAQEWLSGLVGYSGTSVITGNAGC